MKGIFGPLNGWRRVVMVVATGLILFVLLMLYSWSLQHNERLSSILLWLGPVIIVILGVGILVILNWGTTKQWFDAHARRQPTKDPSQQ